MPATIGIIYPPPEVRSIVDKTATFVARNGPEFEEKIRQNEIQNPKFNFLNQNDPYHAYYQHKVKEIAEGKGPEMPPPISSSIHPPQAQPNANQTLPNLQKLSLTTKDTQSKIIEQMIILKDPPPEFQYIIDAPSIMPLDIDVIKLTAQFIARNGRPFLTSLMSKEQRNPMFDFLKPQHSHFSYFNRLVDQYTKILLPPRDLVDKMRKEVGNPFGILKDVAYRVEWDRVQQREKAKEEEQAERERVAYAQVDWHDFVVVETVDYQPNEMGNFPPPTTPQDVGARIIAQERIEAGGAEGSMVDITGRFLIDRIIDDESRVELSSLSKQNIIDEVSLAPPVTSDKNIDQVAMDEDSDDEKQKPADQAKKQAIPRDLPLPPNPDNVIIRSGYDPKANKQQTASKQAESYFKSPLTGELISASKMSEHMRISMLDPRWIEQRQKEKEEKEKHEEVLASDLSIEKNLKRMAEFRSDMFGSGAEEVLIGRKVGEEERRSEEAAVWDGHSNSMDKTSKRAMTGITLEEQIKAIHQSQGLVEDESLMVKIGPTIPRPVSSMPAMSTHSVLIKPAQPPQPVQQGGFKMAPPPPQQPVKPVVPVMPVAPEPAEEPAAKRLKTAEELLIPEADYLSMHANNATVKFYVQVPSVPEKPEWSLNGQMISLVLPLTEQVNSILIVFKFLGFSCKFFCFV
jgi:splicing factor 3A subunit 1